MSDNKATAIYSELGISPIINAIGSVTLLGGSTPPQSVLDAMDDANSTYVPLEELEKKAGSYIADMVGAKAVYITSGAGSALTLATAALMAGDNDDLITKLPDTSGMKDEILIQARQRYHYERCLTLAGAKLVEFGNKNGTNRDDLESSITEKTVAVHYVANETFTDPNVLSLEETIDIAKSKNVPVMVDAAGQVYPIENIGKYVNMGAEFSAMAAKYIGAPHSTGFAIGTEEMIRKISLHSFIAYEMRRIRGVGRPQKIDRQEIIGAVAAVKLWTSINHEDRLSKAYKISETIASYLKNIQGIKVQVKENSIGHDPFGVTIELEDDNKSLLDVVENLKNGKPSIWLRCNSNMDGVLDDSKLAVSPFGLQDGEEEIVGARLAEELKNLN
ncbi:MAG: aminotransferase class V-fold PLP-dependent enzyme [Dehalococcoidia bacterium]|jgi:uncharacterized pyridoxal phosphate-dependent enzyme|nr:aminotransferase class V-fold PLP-dependent enzyme [Dehalococcoidia bacterium]HJN58919.1 aminotransferase class V-fold PLP-dependent enzyme [Dehalococcoidia bacterium]